MPGDGGSPRRLIVAVTGGEGAGYAVRLLDALRDLGVETHLVVEEEAVPGVEAEAGARTVADLTDHLHQPSNQAARISSGSFLVDGMALAPCTVVAASAIAHGVGAGLIHRAADVTIKEGRRLALLILDEEVSPLVGENLEKLAAIPGVSVVRPAPGPVDDTVHLLLQSVGIERKG